MAIVRTVAPNTAPSAPLPKPQLYTTLIVWRHRCANAQTGFSLRLRNSYGQSSYLTSRPDAGRRVWHGHHVSDVPGWPGAPSRKAEALQAPRGVWPACAIQNREPVLAPARVSCGVPLGNACARIIERFVCEHTGVVAVHNLWGVVSPVSRGVQVLNGVVAVAMCSSADVHVVQTKRFPRAQP